jgi:hypothetical protein
LPAIEQTACRCVLPASGGDSSLLYSLVMFPFLIGVIIGLMESGC